MFCLFCGPGVVLLDVFKLATVSVSPDRSMTSDGLAYLGQVKEEQNIKQIIYFLRYLQNADHNVLVAVSDSISSTVSDKSDIGGHY